MLFSSNLGRKEHKWKEDGMRFKAMSLMKRQFWFNREKLRGRRIMYFALK